MIGVPLSSSRRQARSNTIVDKQKQQQLQQHNQTKQSRDQSNPQNRSQQILQQSSTACPPQQREPQIPQSQISYESSDVVGAINSFHITPKSYPIPTYASPNQANMISYNRRRPPISLRSQTIDIPSNEIATYTAQMIPYVPNQPIVGPWNMNLHNQQYHDYRTPVANYDHIPYIPVARLSQSHDLPDNLNQYNGVHLISRPPLNHYQPYDATHMNEYVTNHQFYGTGMMSSSHNHIHYHPSVPSPRVKPMAYQQNLYNMRSNSFMSETARTTDPNSSPKVTRRANTSGNLLMNRRDNTMHVNIEPIKTQSVNTEPPQEVNSNSNVKHKKSPITPMKLSLAGAKRRLGFRKKGLTQISVHRSEEVIPNQNRHLFNQSTCLSSYSEAGHGYSDPFPMHNMMPPMTSEFRSLPIGSGRNYVVSPGAISNSSGRNEVTDLFVGDLGEGQVVSRQALVSPHLGDIQLSLSTQRGMLEVEVIRARNLHKKASATNMPNPYVKVYLMKGKICVAKFKTEPAHETLNPLYQTRFVFREPMDIRNCILQVIVWGDYGRKDRKSLMGIAQLHLDQADLSVLHIGWYKLFNLPSLSGVMLSSQALRNKLLSLKDAEDSNANHDIKTA